MNIIICDNDYFYIRQISTFIHQNMLQQNIISTYHIDTCTSNQAFLSLIKDKVYDIAFIDIDSYQNVDLAKQLTDSNANAIINFISHSHTYIDVAFSLNIFQYWKKPINLSLLKDEFLRMIATYKLRNFKFILHTTDGNILFKTKDILYVETYYRHLKIVTTNHYYFTNIKQKEMLMNILETSQFIKIQRSYLVNMNHILSIHHNSVLLDNNEFLPTSPHRRKQILERFHHFTLYQSN